MSSRMRDKVYLPIVGTQLLGMLLLDLVPLYPECLWRRPSSPLHALVSLRAWWAARSGDPYFGAAQHEPWFEAFLYVEALVQLPLTLYLVAELGSLRPTSGAAELAGLAYGCVTFMGAVACCCEIWRMGPDRVRDEHWGGLFWGTYLPFCIVAGVMAVDMYLRLLPRVQTPARRANTASRAS